MLGVGVEEVQLAPDIVWAAPSIGPYRVMNSHADQPESLLPGARVLDWNEHYPASMGSVADRDPPIHRPDIVNLCSRRRTPVT